VEQVAGQDGEGFLFVLLFQQLLEDRPEDRDVSAGLVKSRWVLPQDPHRQIFEGVGAEAGEQCLDEGQSIRKVPIGRDEDPSLTQMVPQDLVIEFVAIVGQQDDHAIIGYGLHPPEEILGCLTEMVPRPHFVHVKLQEVLHMLENEFLRAAVAVKEAGIEGLQAAHLKNIRESILGDEPAVDERIGVNQRREDVQDLTLLFLNHR